MASECVRAEQKATEAPVNRGHRVVGEQVGIAAETEGAVLGGLAYREVVEIVANIFGRGANRVGMRLVVL